MYVVGFDLMRMDIARKIGFEMRTKEEQNADTCLIGYQGLVRSLRVQMQ